MWCRYPHFKEGKTDNHSDYYVLFNQIQKPQKYWYPVISIWKMGLGGLLIAVPTKEGRESSQGLLSGSDSCLSSG